MKTKRILITGATIASAAGLALISSSVADHKPGHPKDAHYSAEDRAVVDKAVCDSEKAKMTASSSYNPRSLPAYIDEMLRPVNTRTARGGAIDLARNTRPMFDENWGFISYDDRSREWTQRDSDRILTDPERSVSWDSRYDRDAAGTTTPRLERQTIDESSRSYNNDRTVSDTQVNPNLDSTIVVPDSQTRRNIDQGPDAATEDALRAGQADRSNRDRLLSRDQSHVQASPSDGSTREARVDADVAEQLCAAIKADDSFSADAKNIEVVVENDTLTLRGSVASQAEKDNIEQKAKQLAGIKQVKNNLEIKQ